MGEPERQICDLGPELLAVQLAKGVSVRDAARDCGISETTAYRRLRDPEFRRTVSQLRGEMVDQVVGRIVTIATEAVDTLAKLLNAQSETVRVTAARAILELGTRLRESVEIEERLAALELRMKE